MRFSGSGGEYFRVWVVNVLLSIVTLSLYTPWARRRKAQYFFSHTQVIDTPLEFVGRLRQMVFGFLVFASLYIAYELATQTEQDVAATALLWALAALLPLLWGSAMRFRLGATRWRGLHLGFGAGPKELYLAAWPALLIAGALTGWFYASLALVPPPSPIGVCRAPVEPSYPPWNRTTQGLGALALLICLAALARLDYNFKRLLVSHAFIGGEDGRFKPTYGQFLKIWVVAALIVCAGLALLVVPFWLGHMDLSDLGLWAFELGDGGMASVILGMLLFYLSLALLFVLASGPARAYREARVFRRVWNHTGVSGIARFRTTLRTWSYVRLRLRNLVLTVLTLGLYRPFAVASEYAARVDSLRLYVKGGTDQLVGRLARQQQGGVADAAANVLGLDLV